MVSYDNKCHIFLTILSHANVDFKHKAVSEKEGALGEFWMDFEACHLNVEADVR